MRQRRPASMNENGWEREREMGLKKFDDDKVQTPYIYDERIEFGRITCWGCLYISIKNQSCHSFASCGCCELVNKWSCASQGGAPVNSVWMDTAGVWMFYPVGFCNANVSQFWRVHLAKWFVTSCLDFSPLQIQSSVIS